MECLAEMFVALKYSGSDTNTIYMWNDDQKIGQNKMLNAIYYMRLNGPNAVYHFR